MQNNELEKLLLKIRKYIKDIDISLVEKAYYFAQKAHEGQYRKSG